jgi:hypothetical protein
MRVLRVAVAVVGVVGLIESVADATMFNAHEERGSSRTAWPRRSARRPIRPTSLTPGVADFDQSVRWLLTTQVFPYAPNASTSTFSQTLP